MFKNYTKEQQELFDHVGKYLETLIGPDKCNTTQHRRELMEVLVHVVLTFKAFCYLSDVRDKQSRKDNVDLDAKN